jgi:hypothetical protein
MTKSGFQRTSKSAHADRIIDRHERIVGLPAGNSKVCVIDNSVDLTVLTRTTGTTPFSGPALLRPIYMINGFIMTMQASLRFHAQNRVNPISPVAAFTRKKHLSSFTEGHSWEHIIVIIIPLLTLF